VSYPRRKAEAEAAIIARLFSSLLAAAALLQQALSLKVVNMSPI
jgi:hypothetical protein